MSVNQCQGTCQVELSNLWFSPKFGETLLSIYRVKYKLPCDILRLVFKIFHILAWISYFMVCPVIPFSKPSTQAKSALSVFQSYPKGIKKKIIYYSTSIFLYFCWVYCFPILRSLFLSSFLQILPPPSRLSSDSYLFHLFNKQLLLWRQVLY